MFRVFFAADQWPDAVTFSRGQAAARQKRQALTSESLFGMSFWCVTDAAPAPVAEVCS